jgi:hypothetical protein
LTDLAQTSQSLPNTYSGSEKRGTFIGALVETNVTMTRAFEEGFEVNLENKIDCGSRTYKPNSSSGVANKHLV